MALTADLLIIWAWEYDADFVTMLMEACARHGLHAVACDESELPALPERLERGELRARVALDRAWDWGDEYERHVAAVQRHVPLLINDYEHTRRIWNKFTVHLDLITHGLHAPYLILLPSYYHDPNPAPPDLSVLGGRFSVKPAHGGGSGVLQPAATWREILERRQAWPADETILQAWVEPKLLGGRRAWFRVFYACGSTFLCWADDRTHIHEPVTPQEEQRYHLSVLRGMTQHIASLSGLNLFSTEFALDQHNLWQVCDAINEPCDFRLKSKADNGVPDAIVKSIAERIASWVKRKARAAPQTAA